MWEAIDAAEHPAASGLAVEEGDRLAYEGLTLKAPKDGRPLVEGLRVVREGLKPDNEVVVDGIVKVRPGAPVNPEPGDMNNYLSAEEAGVVASSAPAGPGPNQPRSGGSQR